MIRFYDFKIGWRLLLSAPIYSSVVIAGLSLGFAAFILLIGFVRYSCQYNSAVPDVANVYVVKQRFNIDPAAPWFDQTPYLLRNVAIAHPSVLAVTGFDPNMQLPVRIGDRLSKLQVLPVLPGFAEMLGLTALEGDLNAALGQPESVGLTEQAAQKYFGTEHALGMTLQTGGKVLRVAAVLRNPPSNNTIPFESLVGMQSLLVDDQLRKTMLTGQGNRWGKLLIRVKPGASIADLTGALQQAIDRSPLVQNQEPEGKQRLGTRKVMDIKLTSLADAYFDQEIAANPNTLPGERGNPVLVAGLGAIAGLILALAAINYVNLATVRVLQRQREIAMRKALGATGRQIVAQFVAESLLVALLAALLGLVLAWLTLPMFAELMSRKLDGLFATRNLLPVVLASLLVGVASAAYPAWMALRVRPLHALRGRANDASVQGGQLRRILTVVQIAVALSLASITLAIAWQTHYATQASPGFDPQALFIVDLPVAVKDNPQAQGLLTALQHQEGITSVAITGDAVGRSRTLLGMDFKRPGQASVFLDLKSVSANFFEQYQLKPVAGRLFDSRVDQEDDPVPTIINMVAVRKLGFASAESAIGQPLLFTGPDGKPQQRRIIGVAPELRFQSLRSAAHATAWELWTRSVTLSVRTTLPIADAEQLVQGLWRHYFPDDLPEIISAQAVLDANYASDTRLARLLALATVIVLAIAAFGLYALSAYSVQRRAREIVMRKLYGARQRDIAWLVVREIGTLMGLAALVGLPIAAVAIQSYLSGYVEHAAIGYWTLLFSVLAAVVIATLAVARHTLIAIRMLPAAALTM